MNRIENAFKNKPIFMPYFPLGYPDLDTSIDVIEALAKNGADLIEVGLSFSDPLADGPVIQKATQIALENGITVKKSLQAVAELRKRGADIPLVLMGYYNPMLAYGLDKFVCDTVDAGADGFIIPDLPMEESEEFQIALRHLHRTQVQVRKRKELIKSIMVKLALSGVRSTKSKRLTRVICVTWAGFARPCQLHFGFIWSVRSR